MLYLDKILAGVELFGSPCKTARVALYGRLLSCFNAARAPADVTALSRQCQCCETRTLWVWGEKSGLVTTLPAGAQLRGVEPTKDDNFRRVFKYAAPVAEYVCATCVAKAAKYYELAGD